MLPRRGKRVCSLGVCGGVLSRGEGVLTGCVWGGAHWGCVGCAQ